MKKVAVALISLVLIACARVPDGPVPTLGTEMGSLDPAVAAEVDRVFEESGIPSMAVAVVVGDELVWAKGLGEQPDLSTIYMIGSIDKPYLATAIMVQVEEGLIGLDDDISQYLPFEFRSPSAPDLVLTPRMLLLHQTGLTGNVPGTRYVDNDRPMNWWRFWHQGQDLGDLWYAIVPYRRSRNEIVEKAFAELDPAEIWTHSPNGGLTYSNTGFYEILGRVIGEIEGGTYQDVVRCRVIEPFGLENTSYEASSFPKGQLAIPYSRQEGRYRQLPITGLTASGRLRSNVLDLARFMTLHMNDGSLDGVQVIPQESIAEMHARGVVISSTDWISMRLVGWGLGWQLWTDDLMGHSGAIPGFMGQMTYRDAEVPHGVVVLINSGCSTTQCDWDWLADTFGVIRDTLLEEAARLAEEQ
jgi:CubicO group peptidase (beta-lactamase class C family)